MTFKVLAGVIEKDMELVLPLSNGKVVYAQLQAYLFEIEYVGDLKFQ
ncbi:hypothetical protein [Runella zeae]|nr:hypothetical protein [Runella zeae]